MYCKQCGNQVDDNAKFCASCGSPTADTPQQTFTAPKPFETNSVDGSRNPQFQKSAFKGVQKSVGSSGSVSFGNRPEKQGPGFFGKLFKLGFIVVALAVVAIIAIYLFMGDGPIYNVESGTGYDATLSDLTGKTETFTSTDPEIYIIFDYEELELGELYVSLYYADETTSTDQYSFTISNAEGWGWLAFPRPGGAWEVGEYTIEFVMGEELIRTYTFDVE